ncbi:MAG: hypothetical protein LBG80_11245 [Bacteroidales bacterium]|jgi:hypothetical protein|nr:hypothetical protein [Bacteroidales bacterium]
MTLTETPSNHTLTICSTGAMENNASYSRNDLTVVTKNYYSVQWINGNTIQNN